MIFVYPTLGYGMRSPRPLPPPRCLRPRRGRRPTRRNSLSSELETGVPVSSDLYLLMGCWLLLSRSLLVFSKVFKITWSSSMETKLYCSSKVFSSSSSTKSISFEVKCLLSLRKSSEPFSSTFSIRGMLFWMVAPMRRYIVIQPRQCMFGSVFWLVGLKLPGEPVSLLVEKAWQGLEVLSVEGVGWVWPAWWSVGWLADTNRGSLPIVNLWSQCKFHRR